MAQERGAQVRERRIAPTLHEYVSRPAFERACRDFLWRSLRAETLSEGLHFAEVGTWWGAGDVEIDVVAVDEQGAVTAAGSCKWTKAAIDVSEYAALQTDLAKASFGSTDPFLFLFSRSGFTDRLQRLAAAQEPPRLFLVDLPQMYAV